MRILHCSDIHYSHGSSSARAVRPVSLPAAEFYPAMVEQLGDTLPAFEACLREGLAADGAGKQPDVVVLTGDFVERGGAKAYCQVGEAFARISTEMVGCVLPCVVTPGNHDERAALRAGWPEVLPGTGADPLLYTRQEMGTLFISFDTSEPGHADGYLDADRLDWLRSVLDNAAAQGQFAVVCTHHHLDPGQSDMPVLPGVQELLDVLRRPQVVLLNGHTHHQAHRAFEGVEYFTADATSFQADPLNVCSDDGTYARAVRFRRLRGFNVYDVDDNRVVRAQSMTCDANEILGDMLLG